MKAKSKLSKPKKIALVGSGLAVLSALIALARFGLDYIPGARPNPDRGRLSVRYCLLSEPATDVFFRGLLGDRPLDCFDSREQRLLKDRFGDDKTESLCLEDLKLGRRPYVLPQTSQPALVSEHWRWRSQRSFPTKQPYSEDDRRVDVTPSLRAWYGRKSFADSILANSSSRESAVTETFYPEGAPDGVVGYRKVITVGAGRGRHVLFSAEPTDLLPCAFPDVEIGDTLWTARMCDRRSVVADVWNAGKQPVTGVVLHGSLSGGSPWKLSEVADAGPLTDWSCTVPVELQPGEHVFVYVASVLYAQTYDDEPVPLYLGPALKLTGWDYRDAVSSARNRGKIRQFDLANVMTVSPSVGIGSCPYAVFRSSSGATLSEGRALVGALGMSREACETLLVPRGAVTFSLEEREPEVSRISEVGLLPSSPDGSARVIATGIELRPGQTWSTRVPAECGLVIVRGYYETWSSAEVLSPKEPGAANQATGR